MLDEPFEALDPASRSDLVELLNRFHREQGVSLVIATHDVNVVAAMADQVYVLLRGGEIVAQGTPREIFREPGVLRRSNIEPPVLAELFERLEDLGIAAGRPLTVDEAARALKEWIARRVPRVAGEPSTSAGELVGPAAAAKPGDTP